MTLDERRHHDAKAKARAAARLRHNGVQATPKMIGRNAATHGTCACHACRAKDPVPLRKLRRDERLIYWMEN